MSTVKEQNAELKTELKEFKKEFAEYKDEAWERYVELNTKTYNQGNKLEK